MGPLAGVKVIEMAGLGPCPLAGQLLADMGATVTVIDRRSGEDFSGDVNRRGKRSIAVDLKSAEGREVVLRLCETADVLIEGFRPGVMERLGLGPNAMLARNGRLIYGRMTGWGQEGPLAQSAGHDLTYMAISGALHAMGEPGRPPVPPLNFVADYAGGSMFLLAGVLAALVERSNSGKGQVVDAAMVDGVPALIGIVHALIARGLWTNRRGDNLLDGGAPFYRCYEAADGKFVAVGALEPQFFAILVEKTGISRDWLKAQMDKRRWSELAAELGAAIKTKTRDAWAAIFEGTDGCVAPVLDWSEAPAHPHNAARGNHIRLGNVTQAAPAPRFSRTAAAEPIPAGKAGAQTDAVLAEAGFDDQKIDELRRSGALT